MVRDEQTLNQLDGIAADEIRAQLDRLSGDPVLHSSKRSIAFLRYVVDETLRGASDSIKERTIGVDLYRRSPTYDTNADHVVRTAAAELRKRLALYYSDPKHQAEIRVALTPGSYVPRFSRAGDVSTELAAPQVDSPTAPIPVAGLDLVSPARPGVIDRVGLAGVLASVAAAILAILLLGFVYGRFHAPTQADGEHQFWAPLTGGSGPVLIAVGTARDGLPKGITASDGTPLVIPGPAAPRYIPYADAETTAKVVGQLRAMGKAVQIRRSMDTSIDDLRQMPTVLVGAFDNPWSLRLLKGMRFTPEVDDSEHEVYIRDAQHPQDRTWSWKNTTTSKLDGGYGAPAVHDYALISRVHDPRTGQVVLLIAGLEPYGTQAAGDFVTSPELLAALSKSVQLDDARNLQVVIETLVTDGSPGSPRIVAVSRE